MKKYSLLITLASSLTALAFAVSAHPAKENISSATQYKLIVNNLTDTPKTVKEPYAPVPVKSAEVVKHVGESVSVKATITDTRLIQSNGMVLLQVGTYPNQDFTIMIKSDNVAKFGKPEVDLKGKTVVVNGTVILYHEKPEIELTDVKQLKVLSDK